MILGVDRSRHNSAVPAKILKAKGIQYAWYKAAQWLVGEDKTFNASWQDAKNVIDFLRGAYFFFDPRYDGIAQAKLFLSLGIDFKAAGCFGGCVDVEDLVVFNSDGSINQQLTKEANQWVANNWQLAVQRLTDFLNYFKTETGLECVIYTYNNYMKEYYHSHPFPNNPMWLSSVQDTCPRRYDTGKQPEFWQFTYRWNNTDMDGDYFTGTQEQLNKLANISA